MKHSLWLFVPNRQRFLLYKGFFVSIRSLFPYYMETVVWRIIGYMHLRYCTWCLHLTPAPDTWYLTPAPETCNWRLHLTPALDTYTRYLHLITATAEEVAAAPLESEIVWRVCSRVFIAFRLRLYGTHFLLRLYLSNERKELTRYIYTLRLFV